MVFDWDQHRSSPQGIQYMMHDFPQGSTCLGGTLWVHGEDQRKSFRMDMADRHPALGQGLYLDKK